MHASVAMAKDFATKAHEGQTRKYNDAPYISHPVSVAKILKMAAYCTIEMEAAAYLHDTVEDTAATLQDIFDIFGVDIFNHVDFLTDISTLEDGNREICKRIDREHIAKAPAGTKTIKLGDIIHNTHDIVLFDLDFAVTYLKEKALLLAVLKEGDETLWRLAYDLLIFWATRLDINIVDPLE
jgi:guanosine-3',5'-bis(diphosphate) 3'-pyrophosphohydrolase